MKNIKKLTLILIAVVLMFAITGCGESDPSGEADAREVATAFMDCFMDLNFEGALEYAEQDDTEAIEELMKLDIRKEFDNALSEFGTDVSTYAEAISPLYDTIISKLKSSMSYQIKEVSGKGDKYTFTLDITMVDYEQTSDISAKVSESMLSKFSEDTMVSLATELYNEGKITPESTEEEIVNAMFEKIMPEIEETINSLELNTKVTPATMVVSKDSGEWLVDLSEFSI